VQASCEVEVPGESMAWCGGCFQREFTVKTPDCVGTLADGLEIMIKVEEQ
jgi:hypothetical protein